MVVSPQAIQAMFDANSIAGRTGRGPGASSNDGVAVMPVAIPRDDYVIERRGLSEFKIKAKGKQGAAIFRRHGLGWKLAGFDMPYRFGASKP
jgi:hypothetical protein